MSFAKSSLLARLHPRSLLLPVVSAVALCSASCGSGSGAGESFGPQGAAAAAGAAGNPVDASSDGSAASAGQAGAAGTAGDAGKPDASLDAKPDTPSTDGAPEAADATTEPGEASDAGATCKNDNDCKASAAGPYCDPVSSTCVACKPTDPSTCQLGAWCDPATHKCVAGCDSPEDCPQAADAGAITCDTTTHKCVGCVNDTQCPLGQVCKAQACEPGCTPQHGCQSGLTCCGGSCVDTSTDLGNCGGCAKPCSFPNATVSCTGGACTLSGCQAGWDDCDQILSNGCETPLGDGGIGCACPPNITKDCYAGPPNTLNIGPCKAGKQTCNASGTGWSPCQGQVLPSTETCWTPLDDDCDGKVNEDGPGCVCAPNASEPCYTGPAGTRNVGACKDGTHTCNAAGTEWGTCDGQVLPSPETCLTPVDDNCDGQVNEAGGAGCLCTPNTTSSCYGGPPGTQGVGVCKPGSQTCNSMGTGFGPCTGDVVPSPDICTDNLDNDCNGTTNDGVSGGAGGCVCFPLAVSSCYTGPANTSGVGVCKDGVATCAASGAAWGACSGQVVPSTDHCTDSLDNDCNGIVNDGFGKGGQGCACTPGTQQDCYDGPPGTLGVGVCVGGKKTCKANGTGWEACLGQVIPDLDSCLNALDDDCNGVVNDGNHLAPGCACVPGAIKCEGNNKRVCDANGDWGPAQSCGALVCSNVLGCVTCLPGTATCNGNTAHKCKADGSGYVDYVCDPVIGSSCSGGACTGPCAPDALERSYIGCDYFPTVTANSQLMDYGWPYYYMKGNFAVAVSNTSSQAATVTVTQGATTITTQSVAANAVAVITLPWNALQTATSTGLYTKLAYRVRTTQPVTVYQFNPLQYTNGSGYYTYTNDASLLLPVTAWGTQYMVAARNTWVCNQCNGHNINANLPGFYAVVARTAGTQVTLQRSPTTNLRGTVPGLAANGSGTVTLGEGDVLQVMSGMAATDDLTGTIVTANNPVEVIGGHDCTFIPWNVGWCDHIEESIFPMSTLSKEYIVAANALPPGQTSPAYAFTRVIATQANTNITYDPPHAGWPGTIVQAGGYVEVNDNAAFRVITDKNVLVSQYMRGNGDSTLPADPAMALAIPTQQFRTDYLFHAPTNYDSNYVNITAPTGAAVTLDGAAVTGWAPIGATGYSVARPGLSNAGNGNHRITSSVGVGITVYGFGWDTSYWYPGGLNLSDL
jgi:hypothetical protein